MVSSDEQASTRPHTPDAPRGLNRFLPAVVITAVVALAVVLVPLLTVDPEPPAPTPEPGVVASAGEITTVPEAGEDVRRALSRDLSRFFEDLYDRAFVAPELLAEDAEDTDETEPPSPSPGPEARIRNLFTREARAALRDRPDVFDPGPLVIRTGRVSFDGVATLRDGRPVEALLEVDFRTRAEAPGAYGVDVRQRGDLFLVATDRGWRVSGFELRLTSEPVPTPSPTPQ